MVPEVEGDTVENRMNNLISGLDMKAGLGLMTGFISCRVG